MRASRSLRILAWLFDLYVATIVLVAIVGLVLGIARTTGSPAWMLCIGVLSLLVPSAYHLLLARSVSVLSPGERIAGGLRRNGQKHLENPYTKTRAPLFVLVFLTLILVGNAWDATGDALLLREAIDLPGVAVRLVLSAAILLCLVEVGRGRALAMLLPAFVWIAQGVIVWATQSARPGALVVAFLLALPGVGCLAAALLYGRWRRASSGAGFASEGAPATE